MSSPVMTSARLLKRISIISSKPRPFRVAILGQNGVGKTAFCVRFVTRRYIGDYDPDLERVYSCQRIIHGIPMDLEMWDTAGLNENIKLKEKIRWADAVILMYDVTDRCSFNECCRLKFLVNSYSPRMRTRRKTGFDPGDASLTLGIPWTSNGGIVPVMLLGNKTDKTVDRMVSTQEGQQRASQLSCVSFYEVSVKEDLDGVINVFEDLCDTFRKARKSRTGSLLSTKSLLSINERKQENSSEDESEDAADGGRGDGGKMRQTEEKEMQSAEGEKCRRKTVVVARTESAPEEDLMRRTRYRRREAFYTIS